MPPDNFTEADEDFEFVVPERFNVQPVFAGADAEDVDPAALIQVYGRLSSDTSQRVVVRFIADKKMGEELAKSITRQYQRAVHLGQEDAAQWS